MLRVDLHLNVLGLEEDGAWKALGGFCQRPRAGGRGGSSPQSSNLELALALGRVKHKETPLRM